jgi:hypothetical protein
VPSPLENAAEQAAEHRDHDESSHRLIRRLKGRRDGVTRNHDPRDSDDPKAKLDDDRLPE